MTSTFQVVDRKKKIWDVIPMGDTSFQVRPAGEPMTTHRELGSLKTVNDVMIELLSPEEIRGKLSSGEWTMADGTTPPEL